DAPRALRELRRVLKPGGTLLFVEHGRAPEQGVALWQDRLDPLWTRLAGGCHLNRKIDELIAAGGFRIESLSHARLPGPRTHTFLYEGCAKPRLWGARYFGLPPRIGTAMCPSSRAPAGRGACSMRIVPGNIRPARKRGRTAAMPVRIVDVREI